MPWWACEIKYIPRAHPWLQHGWHLGERNMWEKKG
eukprot:COSAG01_NODE_883_length_12927_cov_10.710789_1_plen_34_part_10